jgi:hypothetical protein
MLESLHFLFVDFIHYKRIFLQAIMSEKTAVRFGQF